MKLQVTSSLLLVSSLPLSYAWGAMGHEAIAYIATNFIQTATKTYFQGILGDTTTDFLANVATYADTYRYTTAGKFSAPFHFIDALDSPPTSCGVNYTRDCGTGGCVVSAIQNYTRILLDGRYSAANHLFAAEMIVHFIGDIHQPLHDENLEVGGNDVDVTFAGVATNLHAVWDTSIPEKYTGSGTQAAAKTWATTLTASINTGTYKTLHTSWTSGIKISDPVTSAMLWATDANSYVCSTVMPKGLTPLEDTDLSGAYYTSALPVVELLIAKAGYRLAAWLDLIATGSTTL